VKRKKEEEKKKNEEEEQEEERKKEGDNYNYSCVLTAFSTRVSLLSSKTHNRDDTAKRKKRLEFTDTTIKVERVVTI
jgi:hypothetical protein